MAVPVAAALCALAFGKPCDSTSGYVRRTVYENLMARSPIKPAPSFMNLASGHVPSVVTHPLADWFLPPRTPRYPEGKRYSS